MKGRELQAEVEDTRLPVEVNAVLQNGHHLC
jgi:hypothetical protein